jgi:hypothetical protein
VTSGINGMNAGPVKYMAYVDIVRIQPGVRADERIRVAVSGKTERQVAERAKRVLATHIEHLED